MRKIFALSLFCFLAPAETLPPMSIAGVDKDGEKVYSGGLTDTPVGKNYKHNFLNESLSALRSGKNPPTSKFIGIGCKIQRPTGVKTQLSQTK